MKPHIHLRRRHLLLLGLAAVVATACGGDEAGSATIEPAAAPEQAASEPVEPGPAPADGAETSDDTEPVDPLLTSEQLGANAMASVDARDPFEPVREDPVAAVETAAGEELVVPAAPTGSDPADPDAPAPAAGPSPEPTAATCVTDLAGCLASLRLLDAGAEGQAVFQVGTSLYEVAPGEGFADAFVLLRLEDGCATVAHSDGITERCVEPDSSLK
ncbi:MAG: hypothetical protein WD378_00870 [Egicoccus sp.]